MAGIALKYTYFKSQKDMKNLNLEKKKLFPHQGIMEGKQSAKNVQYFSIILIILYMCAYFQVVWSIIQDYIVILAKSKHLHLQKFLKNNICQNSISCIRFPKLDMNNEIVFIFHKIRFFTPIFILLADVSKNWPRNVSKTVRSNSLIF